jgi:hypothetical protein
MRPPARVVLAGHVFRPKRTGPSVMERDEMALYASTHMLFGGPIIMCSFLRCTPPHLPDDSAASVNCGSAAHNGGHPPVTHLAECRLHPVLSVGCGLAMAQRRVVDGRVARPGYHP